MAYEATVKISAISTDPRAKNPLSNGAAQATARKHLEYITDPKKTGPSEDGLVFGWAGGEELTATTDADRDAIGPAIDKALKIRALGQQASDKNGIRLADTITVSLPNDASLAQQREMCLGIMQGLVGDSEAVGICAIHTDRPGNKHAHFFYVDGLETMEAAKARAATRKKASTKRTRVRRRNHLQMNAAGSYKRIRGLVADKINNVSARDGLRLAEVRSYKDRGIDQKPQRHEGPMVSQARRGVENLPPRVKAAVFRNIDIYAAKGMPSDPLAPVDPAIFPPRLALYTDPAVEQLNTKRKRLRASKAQSAPVAPQSPPAWQEGYRIHETYLALSGSKNPLEAAEGAAWRYRDIHRRTEAIKTRSLPSPRAEPERHNRMMAARHRYQSQLRRLPQLLPELLLHRIPPLWADIRTAVKARLDTLTSRPHGTVVNDRQVSGERPSHRRQGRRGDLSH